MNFPWQTERLILRRFEIGDAEALSAYRSQPEVAQYQSWRTPFTVEQAKCLISSCKDVLFGERNTWMQIAVIEKASNQVIGDCADCFHETDPLSATIGFSLALEFQGKGFAAEMVQELLKQLANCNVKLVRADCDVRNRGSIRLLERLGFTRLEGIRKEEHRGEQCDDIDFELVIL